MAPAAGANERTEPAEPEPVETTSRAAAPVLKLAEDGTPLPAARPERLAAVATTAGSPTTSETQTSLPPAPSPSYRLQLAAYRSHDHAIATWRALRDRYPDDLGALRPYVVRVEIPNRGVFHRLQVGPFPSEAAAQTTCRSLKAKKQDCLIVRP
jgi:cell division septation protein DedD